MATETESTPKTLPIGPDENVQYPCKVQYCGGMCFFVVEYDLTLLYILFCRMFHAI